MSQSRVRFLQGIGRVMFGLGLALLLIPPAIAQSRSPSSPAASQLTAWLAAFDNNDWHGYSAFIHDHFITPPEPMLQDRGFRDQTGGFDLKKIESQTSLKVIALVQERNSDQVVQVELAISASKPVRITTLEMHPIPRPADLPLPHLSEDALVSALRKRLDTLVRKDQFSGVVLLAKDKQPIFENAYGFANREARIPNTLRTRFRIGSMNKMFTAVATLQLVQAGKLVLDSPIGTYLPDYPNREAAAKVTIRELLNHTGGTGDFFGPDFDKHRLELRTHEDYVKLYGNRPLRFEPGSKWEYSNYGFVVLGAIIDKVSGETYYDYVRDHVYRLAGMNATGSEPENQSISNLSTGYTRADSEALHPNADFLPYRGTSAGGGYSTAGDLLRFAEAIRQHKLLDEHYTRLLTTGTVSTPNGAKYAFGFEESVSNGTTCVGHAGGSPGMNGEMEICSASGYEVIALTNIDPPAAQRVVNFIVNRLPLPIAKR
ncbi:MAG: serine hydrolase domain-containing protein [Acidobacteriaceae bacterium]